MCETTTAIHRRRSELDLTNRDIADRMSSALGKAVDPSQVQKYFSGNVGVPIDSIGSFLAALELRAVRAEDEVIDPEELAALEVLARKGLAGRGGRRGG